MQKEKIEAQRRAREVKIGKLKIGAGHPIAVQSMCATHTRDVKATLDQIKMLQSYGADIIRVAADNEHDVVALKGIRENTDACLSVDLQENYKLVKEIAPLVQKIRYNPGHLHHLSKETAVIDKVKFIVDCAGENSCAIRIGVNFGSLDPELKGDHFKVALDSAAEHIGFLDKFGFKDYLVSLKSSDPEAVVAINLRFAEMFPEVPLHLGVTEAGMLPMGERKSRYAFERLISKGIGDTVRVSLTVPNSEKYEEILIGKKIVADIYEGNDNIVADIKPKGLNMISCPSCSRVENGAFVELAYKVKERLKFAEGYDIKVAVMGCRVNGPGETDDADIGLWCSANHVNLKKGGELLGAYSYDEILDVVETQVKKLING